MTAQHLHPKHVFFLLISLLLLVLSMIQPAQASIVIDGKVGGFAEGYSQGFNVTFKVENLAGLVTGGKLYIDETTSALRVGFVAPLILNDNTYGTTRATDWGQKSTNLSKGVVARAWKVVTSGRSR